MNTPKKRVPIDSLEAVKIRHRAEELIHDARCLGLVITIHLEPNHPLRSGDYKEIVELRSERILSD